MFFFFSCISYSPREGMHKLQFGLNNKLGFLGNWSIHNEMLNTLLWYFLINQQCCSPWILIAGSCNLKNEFFSMINFFVKWIWHVNLSLENLTWVFVNFQWWETTQATVCKGNSVFLFLDKKHQNYWMRVIWERIRQMRLEMWWCLGIIRVVILHRHLINTYWIKNIYINEWLNEPCLLKLEKET